MVVKLNSKPAYGTTISSLTSIRDYRCPRYDAPTDKRGEEFFNSLKPEGDFFFCKIIKRFFYFVRQPNHHIKSDNSKLSSPDHILFSFQQFDIPIMDHLTASKTTMHGLGCVTHDLPFSFSIFFSSFFYPFFFSFP